MVEEEEKSEVTETEAKSLSRTARQVKTPPDKIEKPIELNNTTVFFWSEHNKILDGLASEGLIRQIRDRAKEFLDEECVHYDKEKHKYYCTPLEPAIDIHYFNQIGKDFDCDCAFWKKRKEKGIYCAHLLALYLMLKKWNWNKNGNNTRIQESA